MPVLSDESNGMLPPCHAELVEAQPGCRRRWYRSPRRRFDKLSVTVCDALDNDPGHYNNLSR